MNRAEFTCPECGGHTWGTEFANDPERARGHCQNCDYSWSRAHDEELFPISHDTLPAPPPDSDPPKSAA